MNDSQFKHALTFTEMLRKAMVKSSKCSLTALYNSIDEQIFVDINVLYIWLTGYVDLCQAFEKIELSECSEYCKRAILWKIKLSDMVGPVFPRREVKTSIRTTDFVALENELGLLLMAAEDKIEELKLAELNDSAQELYDASIKIIATILNDDLGIKENDPVKWEPKKSKED